MHVCPRCRRANPEVAAFCYFDGSELRPAPGQTLPPDRLPHAFVFPSGRRCATYDQLVEACQEDWPTARDLLRQGAFQQFFTGAGRLDLAQLARDSQARADADVALTGFLAGLPTLQPRTPRLELDPHRLVLGTVRRGERREVTLKVINQGVGVLSGTLTLADGTPGGDWVRLAGDGGNGPRPIKAEREQAFVVEVETRGLPAGQKYAAKITVITNGGAVEVPVRLEVGAQPFPWPPFHGARSPRDMAERMHADPRQAVELIERGELAHWFAVNGWTYPVQGPQARGLAAVQQFFEGLGLSRIPVVQVSETEVRMAPVPPEVVRWEVSLFTEAKKWVYGQVETDVPWLTILTPEVSGPQKAAVAFEVDSSLLEPGRVYLGRVRVTANAGQAITVNVRVDVQGEAAPLTRRLFGSVLVGALLLLPRSGGEGGTKPRQDCGRKELNGWCRSCYDGGANKVHKSIKHPIAGAVVVC